MNKAAFEAKVMEILRANGESRWRGNLDEGSLDPKRLAYFKTSENLFRRREIPGKKDYAIGFVLDASGSMGGAKAEAAKKMALQFFDSMHLLGIPFTVTAFGSQFGTVWGLGEHYTRPEMESRLNSVYAEEDSSDCVLVDYLDPTRCVASTKYHLRANDKTGNLGSNSNGIPAMMVAWENLKKAKGDKIIVMMSDGELCENPYFNKWWDRGDKIIDDVKKWFERRKGSVKELEYKKLSFHKFSKEDEEYYVRHGSLTLLTPEWRKKIPDQGDCQPYFVRGLANGSEFHQFTYWLNHEHGCKTLFMGIMDDTFEKISILNPDYVKPEDCMTVHNLSQAYDALVTKLQKNFSFDYDKKLR